MLVSIITSYIIVGLGVIIWLFFIHLISKSLKISLINVVKTVSYVHKIVILFSTNIFLPCEIFLHKTLCVVITNISRCDLNF